MLQLQPELVGLQEQGIDLYVVATGRASDVRSFFVEGQIEAVVLHDNDMTIFQAYDVSAVPFVLFIDKQGRIAYAQRGWSANAYEEAILPVLTSLQNESGE
jgi:peroxiredoxin